MNKFIHKATGEELLFIEANPLIKDFYYFRRKSDNMMLHIHKHNVTEIVTPINSTVCPTCKNEHTHST